MKRAVGDDNGEAETLNLLAGVHLTFGDMGAAAGAYRAAIDRFRRAATAAPSGRSPSKQSFIKLNACLKQGT